MPFWNNNELMLHFYGRFHEHTMCRLGWRFMCRKVFLFCGQFSLELANVRLELRIFRDYWVIRKRVILWAIEKTCYTRKISVGWKLNPQFDIHKCHWSGTRLGSHDLVGRKKFISNNFILSKVHSSFMSRLIINYMKPIMI